MGHYAYAGDISTVGFRNECRIAVFASPLGEIFIKGHWALPGSSSILIMEEYETVVVDTCIMKHDALVGVIRHAFHLPSFLFVPGHRTPVRTPNFSGSAILKRDDGFETVVVIICTRE